VYIAAHFKTRRVVRKGSIYRTGVVLKTKTNLYFYRRGYHTSKTTIPYYKAQDSIFLSNTAPQTTCYLLFLHHCGKLK
jgi:hypothetical protein